jgi:outer membrane protein TolC
MRFISMHLALCMLCLVLWPGSSGVAAAQQPPQPRKLTLVQAIDFALKNNHALAIARYKVVEMQSAKRASASDYFPKVTNSSSYVHYTQTSLLQFAKGDFGTVPGIGPLPSKNLVVNQGSLDHELSSSEVAQPLTQLIKVHDANRAARADESAARDDLDSLREQVAIAVRQLYYGLLSVQLDQKTAAEQIHVAEQQIAEAEHDVQRGSELEVTLLEARSALLQARQDQLTANIRSSDLVAQFNDVLGFPQGTTFDLDDQLAETTGLPNKSESIQLAQSAAPEIKSAEETLRKAEAGVAAARAEYIPDITAFGRHDYQNGVAFLFHNYGVVGLSLTYTLFDGGKRGAVLHQRLAERDQAAENLRRLKDDAAVNVQKAFDKIDQSHSLVDVARQSVQVSEESDRLAGVQLRFGEVVNSKRLQAVAALAKARSDLLKAQLGYLESQAELSVLIGRLPR